MVPSFANRHSKPIDGSYLVTFRENDEGSGRRVLANELGIRTFLSAKECRTLGDADPLPHEAQLFDELNVCCVHCSGEQAVDLQSRLGQTAIHSIEPNHEVFTVGHLLSHSIPPALHATYLDSGDATWGLMASGAVNSQYTGAGVSVAVLDSGLDVSHPDFASIRLVDELSLSSGSPQGDGNGHGTHCAGTVVGPLQPSGAPTYGVARNVDLYVGKVVDDHEKGSMRQVIAGIAWAVSRGCRLVSVSLGAAINVPSATFEQAARRALAAGTLVIAPAGNNANREQSQPGFVIRPGNSRSVLAVGAVDRNLQLANFSSRSSVIDGGEVDLVAPGVEVFSSWTRPSNYRVLSGTSMAVPYVTGIAALHAEATQKSSRELWQVLLETARVLSHPRLDSGAGLIQAPSSDG